MSRPVVRLQRTEAPTLARWVVLLSHLTLAGAVILLFGLWPLEGGDLWMWMTVGRWTWQHGGPPLVDVFSYVTAGEPLIAHSWLAGLVFYLIEQAVGVIGFGRLRFSLILVALGFAARTAKILGAPWPSVLLLAPFVLGIMWARLEFRPHLFTTAFLAFELWLLVSVHLGQRSWPWLWALLPVFAAWIILHGGCIQGLAMLLVCSLALGAMEARRRWLGSRVTDHLSLWYLALVLAACGFALLINPYGLRLLWFPFEMQADWIRCGCAEGSEWQSTWANSGWRKVGGGVVVSMEPVFWLYVAALVGVLFVTIRRWRTADLVPVAVMDFWAMMSLWHLRAVSDAVLLTSPFLVASLPSWRKWPVVVGVGLTLGVIALSLPHTISRVDGWTPRHEEALPFLNAAVEHLGLSGRVYSPEANHWLLRRFHPAVLVESTWEFVG